MVGPAPRVLDFAELERALLDIAVEHHHAIMLKLAVSLGIAMEHVSPETDDIN